MLKLTNSARACFACKRLVSFSTAFTLAITVVVAAPDTASATGGSWGGSGGFGSSGGSWGGSSGSSWGGSSGGSGGGLFGGRRPIRNLLGRIGSRLQRGSGGSFGSGGSHGGSFGGSMGSSWSGSGGGYTSGSSSAAYGSWGSSHVSSLDTNYVSSAAAPVYSAPVMSQPTVDMTNFIGAASSCPTCASDSTLSLPIQQGITETGYSADTGFYDGSMPSYDGSLPLDDGSFDGGSSAPTDYYDDGGLLDDGVMPPTPGPASSDSTMRQRHSVDPTAAILSISLPVEAKVYINGQLTKTKGSVRNYVSRNLKEGQEYDYRVKVVVEREGKRLVRTQTVSMKTGITRTVQVSFDQPATTMLALQVPADAKVRLCGSETAAKGELRVFETSKLADGETWKDYQIEVTITRNGKKLVSRKTLELHAGDSHEVAFDFQSETDQLVASK